MDIRGNSTKNPAKQATKTGTRDSGRSVGSVAEVEDEKPLRERLSTLGRDELVSQTARLVDEALDLLENAKRGDDRRTALQALKEARDGIQLLLRVGKHLDGDGVTLNFDLRKQSIALAASLEASGVSDAVIRSIAWSDGVIDAESRPVTTVTVQNDAPALPAGEPS